MVDMDKKVLSEIALYYGDVSMPKGFEIDRNKLQADILKSHIHNKKFPYSRESNTLNTYLTEHINVEYGFQLVSKETWGNIYKPKEISVPLFNIFIMFPSTQMYYITNTQKDSLNFTLTLTHEFI